MKISIISVILIMSGVVILTIPPNVYSDSDITSEIKFEHIMAIDIHDQSVVVYAQTDIPIVCQVEYIATESDLTDPLVVSHSVIPHTGHIVKILDLTPNTEYEFSYVGKTDGQKINSEKSSFVTLQD